MDKRVVKCIGGVSATAAKDIKPGMALIDDLKFDSLDLIDLAIQIEAEFDIIVTDDDIGLCVTAGDVDKLVKIAGRQALRTSDGGKDA